MKEFLKRKNGALRIVQGQMAARVLGLGKPEGQGNKSTIYLSLILMTGGKKYFFFILISHRWDVCQIRFEQWCAGCQGMKET